MSLASPERRSNPRVYIDGPMQYRQVESSDFLSGRIDNISADGAFVWVGEELPLESKLVVRVELESPDEDCADLVATLLYKLPDEDNALHGYGCSISLV